MQSEEISDHPGSSSPSNVFPSQRGAPYPWIKSHKMYACQRCLNHNLTVARKDHKKTCPFVSCQCADCELVDKRRELNAALARVKQMDSADSMKENSVSGCPRNSLPFNPNTERLPHCQRCAQHNVQNRLKGHKRHCAFKDCPCAKCKVVVERQRLMADQIKLRRRQKKQKTHIFSSCANLEQSHASLASETASTSTSSVSTASSTLSSASSVSPFPFFSSFGEVDTKVQLKPSPELIRFDPRGTHCSPSMPVFSPRSQIFPGMSQTAPAMPHFQLLLAFYSLQQQLISNSQQFCDLESPSSSLFAARHLD